MARAWSGTFIITRAWSGTVGVFGTSLDANAQTLINAMSTTPDSTRQTLISDTITSLKDAGIWTALDELWFLAAHAEQAGLLGWKRYKDATAVNAPTFTADRGFAGDGTTSYLNSNFTASTDGVQYALNDASIGIYSRTNSIVNALDIAAMGAAAANRTQVLLRFSDNLFYAGINGLNLIDIAVASSLGLGVSRRTASDAVQAYRNGSQITSGAPASEALVTKPLYIGARNNNGTADFFSTRQYAFAFVGAAMTAQQQNSLYTIVQAYMTSVGANV